MNESEQFPGEGRINWTNVSLDQSKEMKRTTSIVEEVKQRFAKAPYSDAIKALRKIQQTQSPTKKLDCLVEAQDLIS